jgi:uncharacterized protein YukE
MSIFVDAARLITNLGSLGQNFIGVGDPKFSGEYLAASVTSMSADGLTATANAFTARMSAREMASAAKFRKAMLSEGYWEDEIDRYLRRGGEKKGPGVSPILWALTVAEVLELTAGFGPPHEGADLKAGSDQFAKVYEQLGSAFPDDSWQGSASQAYADQNKAFQDLAKTIRDLDAELAAKVKDHADFVTHIRLGFGILKDSLIAALIIELIIGIAVPPPAGASAARTFAMVVAGLGASIAGGMAGALGGCSYGRSLDVDALTTKYGALAAEVKKSSDKPLAAKAKVPAAEQSTVSSFEDISAGMPKMSAPPEAPALASVASGGSSAVAGTPETTSTPGFTMPTLAQLTAMSGQAAKLSGHVTPHATLVNQAMGQIQQIAQMAQQGQEATAPAKERAPKEPAPAEAALVEAAPAEAAERAPIEAAPVGPEQTREPSPSQRVV